MFILRNILVYIIFIICGIIAIFVVSATFFPDKFNQALTHIIQSKYFLQEYQAKVESLNLDTKKQAVKIGKLTLENLEGKIVLQNIVVNYSLSDILAGVIQANIDIKSTDFFGKISKIKVNKLNITDKFLNLENLKIDTKINFFSKEAKIIADNKESISTEIFVSSNIFKIKYLKYLKSGALILNTALQIKNDNNGNIKSFLSAGSIKELANFDSRILAFVPLDNNQKDVLEDFAIFGQIDNAIWDVELDKNFFEEYKLENQKKVAAKVKFHNTYIHYDSYFPMADKTSGILTMDSKNIHVVFNEAKIKATKVLDCNIIINLKDLFNLKMLISGKALGPADNCLAFIEEKDKQKLDKDLRIQNVKGKASTVFNISCHLDKQKTPSFDIKTKISDASFFIKGFEYKDLKVDCSMNDNHLTLDFIGKIYQQQVKTKYQITINEKLPFKHTVNLKAYLSDVDFKEYQSFNLTKGSGYVEAFLDLDEKDINNKLDINVNFDNAALTFKDVGFVKTIGDKLTIKSSGLINDPEKLKLNFKVVGSNDLYVEGSVELTESDSDFYINKCFYFKNDFTAKIFTKNGVTHTYLKGNALDLSEHVELKEFLTKKSDVPSNLEIEVKKVFLKSNIELENFALYLACDETKCNTGSLLSYIKAAGENIDKKKILTLKLLPMENYEEWTVYSDDIGLLLKGLDLYSKLIGGLGTITVQTSRKNTDLGEMLSLIDGSFKINSFLLTDMGLLTKIISVLSFPGLLNAITTTSEAPFTYSQGIFSFKDDVLKFTRASAEGNYFELTAQGEIDTEKKFFKVSGTVVPALFGVNLLIRKLPIIGKLLSGGHRRGIFFAPFFFTEVYE